MKHGLVEVLAYQETLLITAVFVIAILAMIWVGFRRWLQSKERVARLLGEQTAEFRALAERVEARLNAIEQTVIDGRVPAATRIETSTGVPLASPSARNDD